MKTTKTITVGSHVVYTDEAVELFPRVAKIIFEVRDCRLTGAGYVFALAQVGAPAFTNPTRTDVQASDLRQVGQ